ncbi:MAG: carbohydrate binding domain-containing protein [Ardenticatenales bacterium]|nr:carbohydrate binding domain-containing protein [Ardenticatenales bacterium]
MSALVAAAPDTRPLAATDAAPAPIVHGHVLSKRWVYIQNNFQVAANIRRVTDILDAARAAGFNGAVFSDVKFDRLDDGSLIDDYYTNLRAVLDHARSIGMTVLPSTANFGYSSSLLWHDPDLAEGLPVKDAPFRVVAVSPTVPPNHFNAKLVPVDDGVRLANGDFEQLPASGDTFPGWAFQDAPGTATFVDRIVKRSGAASIRMTDLGTTNPGSGNGRVYQRLAVEPFRYYHLSVWIRTQSLSGGEVRALVLAQNPSRTLQWNPVPVAANQEWTRFDATFNTLTHREVLVYLGVWGGAAGTIWWDDASIEPAGFVNLIRRGSTPLMLMSPDKGIEYEESRDLPELRDVAMGRVPYNGVYDLWHEPPQAFVYADMPGSRLHVDDIILASYHHVAAVYGDQVTASLTVPKVFDLLDVMLRSTHREFAAAGAFGGWMFNHDEIRVQGWDESRGFGDGSPGADLAGNVSRLRDMARAIDPAAPVYVWSDMFDPFHNAADTADPYYLVNGNWSGSWEGPAPDITVLNWNHGPKARASAAFFSSRGHRQILAGYYDTPPARFNDRQWLAALEGVPGIDGVMYTQWGSGYDRLAAWAEHVWGGAAWVSPPPASTGTPASRETPGPAPTLTPTTPPMSPSRAPLCLPWAARGR